VLAVLALGAFIALFGHRAKRLISAASLSTALALAASSLTPTEQGVWPFIAGAALVAGLVVGLLLSRLSIALSTSILATYAVPGALNISLPREAALATVPALAAVLYYTSRMREFVPYLTLGAVLFLWPASQVVGPGLAIPLTVLVGTSGYVIQSSRWRSKIRYEKISRASRKHRSKHSKTPHNLQRIRNMRTGGSREDGEAAGGPQPA